MLSCCRVERGGVRGLDRRWRFDGWREDNNGETNLGWVLFPLGTPLEGRPLGVMDVGLGIGGTCKNHQLNSILKLEERVRTLGLGMHSLYCFIQKILHSEPPALRVLQPTTPSSSSFLSASCKIDNMILCFNPAVRVCVWIQYHIERSMFFYL